MIKCICWNDKDKPSEIKAEHWVKDGKVYSILMIYNMVMQEGILGVVLKEIDLEAHGYKYSCFRMDRFVFMKEDLDALIQLAKDCAELNDFNVEELLTEQLELV